MNDITFWYKNHRTGKWHCHAYCETRDNHELPSKADKGEWIECHSHWDNSVLWLDDKGKWHDKPPFTYVPGELVSQ